MKFHFHFSVFIALIFVGFYWQSCKHQPIPPDTSSLPCDASVVYFNRDVLPILVSNCAKSGCHDATSHKEGVNLTNYDKVMQTGGVKAGKPSSSDLYESIISTGQNAMPPSGPLSEADKQTIEKWITQGAKNLTCKDQCDTVNVTYTNTIAPMLVKSCNGCHTGIYAGGGIDLSTYNGAKEVALNGRLYGSVSYASGFSAMPKGGTKLTDCQLLAMDKWVKAGAPNN